MSNWNWSDFDRKVTKTDKRDRDSAVVLQKQKSLSPYDFSFITKI